MNRCLIDFEWILKGFRHTESMILNTKVDIKTTSNRKQAKSKNMSKVKKGLFVLRMIQARRPTSNTKQNAEPGLHPPIPLSLESSRPLIRFVSTQSDKQESQSASQPASQPDNQPATSPAASQPVSQPAKPASQPAGQPANLQSKLHENHES